MSCSRKRNCHCRCLDFKSSRKKEKNCKKIKCIEKNHFCSNRCNNALIETDTRQEILSSQVSDSLIIVKNSCDVNITATDTQTVVIFQTFIQILTIFLLSIGLDTNAIRLFLQEVSQAAKSIQLNRQRVIIKESRAVNVTTSNNDTAIFIQSFLQALTLLLTL
ncbi:spore coat protein [Priestia megaterium]|uniref:spore coat protein n=1 Tax=Priestia megaterium TaxID=1404 RepID=UPI002B244A59|nr:spore coat protein [Priestia megaterium]MEB2268340.1 spore coat protein [Priestia megaterium]